MASAIMSINAIFLSFAAIGLTQGLYKICTALSGLKSEDIE